jgi:hypothetical protein
LTLATIFAVSALCASSAGAEDEQFDVSVSVGQVTLKTHSGWHISKEYPWRLVAGDAGIDKTRFALEETTATVRGAPPGPATLKGAICSGDKCRSFQKELTIK